MTPYVVFYTFIFLLNRFYQLEEPPTRTSPLCNVPQNECMMRRPDDFPT